MTSYRVSKNGKFLFMLIASGGKLQAFIGKGKKRQMIREFNAGDVDKLKSKFDLEPVCIHFKKGVPT